MREFVCDCGRNTASNSVKCYENGINHTICTCTEIYKENSEIEKKITHRLAAAASLYRSCQLISRPMGRCHVVPQLHIKSSKGTSNSTRLYNHKCIGKPYYITQEVGE